MAKGQETRAGLALLCGALALAAVLMLGGTLLSAAALWPTRRVVYPSAPAPAPRPVGTSTARPGAADAGAPHLVVRESPVAAAEVMGPGRFEYNDQLGDELLARIHALGDHSAELSLVRTNAALAPFGYRLKSRFDDDGQKTLYDLYRQDQSEPLLADLASIWRVSVNASGTEFVLVAENGPGTRPPCVLVRNGQVEPWDPGPSGLLPPAYVGDTLAHIATTGSLTITYQVVLDGPALDDGSAIVYTGTAVAFGAYMPLRSFTTWDDHWVLEVDDRLIMDGTDIGEAMGYDAAFGFKRIGEQSFYFFERDGLVRLSYGDQVLPDAYEAVFHNQCCEASIHNVEAGPGAVWFHALREGTWYFVEAGLDE